jgi:predicted AlkP superfamily pyrophosphatase or phosphodiesterase
VTDRKPVVLIVIDGLTPSMLEATDAPTLRFLLEQGSYRRSASTFPSLTPVCLASIATGGHPNVHGIPHLVWWNRNEQRLVEYGSSFGALIASGLSRGIRDSIVNLNKRHLLRSAETVFESLEDAGLTTAAINITTYRGRNRHTSPIPVLPPVYGPKRFFFFSMYESDRTGATAAWRNRAAGTIDAYAGQVGRWLVTRNAFDLMVFYLPDYDYASHAVGPDTAHDALARADAAIAALVDAAGGRDEFLERYAVVLCSDHGQSHSNDLRRQPASSRRRARPRAIG